jgi:hypothetical protein
LGYGYSGRNHPIIFYENRIFKSPLQIIAGKISGDHFVRTPVNVSAVPQMRTRGLSGSAEGEADVALKRLPFQREREAGLAGGIRMAGGAWMMG